MVACEYARVSTYGQTLEAQVAALKAAACTEIFSEKISGAITDRKALAKAIDTLSKGNTLIVSRLDRLARSTRDLFNTLDAIAKKGAGFKSLADVWEDTTTPHGRLMLAVLGGLADFEREFIRTRTAPRVANALRRTVYARAVRRISSKSLASVSSAAIRWSRLRRPTTCLAPRS